MKQTLVNKNINFVNNKQLFIKQIKASYFRNYKNLELNLSADNIVLVGHNGAGKTNILDAVHYLSMCKSYMNVVDRQNIRFDQPFFVIQGDWVNEEQTINIHCAVKLGSKKVFRSLVFEI